MTRLIGMIRKPFKYQVRPVDGPGSTGVLFVEGEKFNVERVYRSMPVDPSLLPQVAANSRPNTPLMVENQMSLPANSGADPFDYLAAQVASAATVVARVARRAQSVAASPPGKPGGRANPGAGRPDDRSDQ